MTHGDDIEILSYGEPPETGGGADGGPPPDHRRRRLLTALAIAAVAVVATVEYAPWSSRAPATVAHHRRAAPSPTPSIFSWLDAPDATPTLTAFDAGASSSSHQRSGLGTMSADYTVSTSMLDPITIVGFTAEADGAVNTMNAIQLQEVRPGAPLRHPIIVSSGHPVRVTVSFDVHQPGCRRPNSAPTLSAFIEYHGRPTDRIDFVPPGDITSFADAFEGATGCDDGPSPEAAIPVGAPVILEPQHGTRPGDLGRLPIDQSVYFGTRCSTPTKLTLTIGTEQPFDIPCSDVEDNAWTYAPPAPITADVRVSAPPGVTWSVSAWRDTSAIG